MYIKNILTQNKTWIAIVCCFIFGAGVAFLLVSNKNQNPGYENNYSNESLPLSATIVSPQGVHIQARVADTDKTRELGLSYFKTLPDKQGMWFVFPQLGIYSFWMKDMNFPIDIIWLDEQYKIIDRIINANPSDYPKTYTPAMSAVYVLEIPANTADTYGFFVGATAQVYNNQ